MITIFTPTYNRAYLLPKLYESLKKQTFNDFEWLIVDDGSTDDTHDLVDGWMKEGHLNIRYYYQENGGKHRAINKGVPLAKGEWFFIVDSDDSLPDNSLEIANKWMKSVENDETFAGVCGLREINGWSPDLEFEFLDLSPLRIKHIIKVDKAEIFRTKILQNYPFPNFTGENFCAESLIVNRIGLSYNIRYFNEIIYKCKYLRDGLTSNMVKNRRLSANYTSLLYKELLTNAPLFIDKVRASICFWRFVWYTRKPKAFIKIPFWAFFMMPIGVMFWLKDNYVLHLMKNNYSYANA